MSKKNLITLAATLLAVAGFYFYLYRDSFKKDGIQISHTFRPRPAALKGADPDNEEINAIHFGLQHDFRLTSVKVVLAGEYETNKYAHPIWSLITDSNSAPTRAFTYGGRIRGMHPEVKGAKPDPLEANVPYRLLIEAGKLKGEHDFMITEDNHLAP